MTRPLFSESKLLTTTEILRRRSLERFGPGDHCTICEAPVEGFGFCVKCGTKITNAQRCSQCSSSTLRAGVCRDCLGDHAKFTTCLCGWMQDNPHYYFRSGWHIKRNTDGADEATELCPTYWSNEGREIDPEDRRRLKKDPVF